MRHKIVFLFFLFLLFSACGSGGDQEWTIKGDTMALQMGEPEALGEVVNASYGETTVSALRNQRLTDYRKVIIFAGYDSLTGEDVFVDEVSLDYIRLIWELDSEVTYCVGVPNFKNDEDIASLNTTIKLVCGDTFIDTDALIFDGEGNLLPGMTDDDIYPTDYLYDLIVQAILEKDEA